MEGRTIEGCMQHPDHVELDEYLLPGYRTKRYSQRLCLYRGGVFGEACLWLLRCFALTVDGRLWIVDGGWWIDLMVDIISYFTSRDETEQGEPKQKPNHRASPYSNLTKHLTSTLSLAGASWALCSSTNAVCGVRVFRSLLS